MQSLFVLLIISSCFHAIRMNEKCYSCDSISNDGCADPFDAHSISNKEKMNLYPDGVCMKTKTTTKYGTEIIRSVASASAICEEALNSCATVEQPSGVSMLVCCCTDDLCNQASILYQQSMIILCLIITVFVISIYRYT